MSEHNRKSERFDKKIKAIIEGKHVVILENLSYDGGFLRFNNNYNNMKNQFDLDLYISGFKKIKLKCETQWSNNQGVGFKLILVYNDEKRILENFIDQEHSMIGRYGKDRKYRTEIFISLESTNAFRNVYFANYFKFQGIVREKMLLDHISNINSIFEEGISLVTIDAYNRFKRNAYFGDVLVAEVTVSEIKTREAELKINFINKFTGKIIGEGYQRFCCVNKEHKVIKLPKAFDFLSFYHEAKI